MARGRAAVIGGGLSGCEAAGILARAGMGVTIFEQKPHVFAPAYKDPGLGELVCSNSLKSDRKDRPQGWLKDELRRLGSLVISAADASSIPGGEALVVDRLNFSRMLTGKVESLPGVQVVRSEVTDPIALLDRFDAVIVASGPLTAGGLADSIAGVTGEGSLYFYDAISPIVSAQSVDFTRAFMGSRYGRGGDKDYVNCPMTKDEYDAFRTAVLSASMVEARPFEEARYFEACLPIEVIASRGELAMAYGPLSPAGFRDPATGKMPYCLLQLRLENREATAYSLVAFQTRMKYGEQERVIRMIPALANAEFLRFGSIHRNTYINAPELLDENLMLKKLPGLFFAGVLTGVEGYCESAALGMLAGLFAVARMRGVSCPQPPPESCIGALHMHVKGGLYEGGKKRRFQPMNMNRGILPAFQARVPKLKAPELLRERASGALAVWLERLSGLQLTSSPPSTTTTVPVTIADAPEAR